MSSLLQALQRKRNEQHPAHLPTITQSGSTSVFGQEPGEGERGNAHGRDGCWSIDRRVCRSLLRLPKQYSLVGSADCALLLTYSSTLCPVMDATYRRSRQTPAKVSKNAQTICLYQCNPEVGIRARMAEKPIAEVTDAICLIQHAKNGCEKSMFVCKEIL